MTTNAPNGRCPSCGIGRFLPNGLCDHCGEPMRTATALDLEYAERIRSECRCGDNEADHSNADDLLVELLGKLGCTETVREWSEVGKWYA